MIKAPRGTKDILQDEIYLYQYVEDKFHKICRQHNYTEIRTPIFEDANLFIRSIGETSDIVKKEMYTFLDKKGRHLALRPEGTAPIIRAYLENLIYNQQELYKVYYISPMFRYDRPQQGRYRQFHQLGVEAVGSSSPVIDAEVIKLSCEFLDDLKIKYILNLNSVGCPICRPDYGEEIKNFLKDKLINLCDDCKVRYEKNPLRIFDCKVEECKNILRDIPEIFPHLCKECSDHFNVVQNYLKILNINYLLNKNLVRGLDYYTRTTYEIMPAVESGSQSALLGGGRYDNLVEDLGGSKTPAVGMSAGEERIILHLQKDIIKTKDEIVLFIVTLGEEAEKFALRHLFELRSKGIKVEINSFKKSLKSQLKYADKISARYVLIIGENEIRKNVFILRDMYSSIQREITLSELREGKFCEI